MVRFIFLMIVLASFSCDNSKSSDSNKEKETQEIDFSKVSSEPNETGNISGLDYKVYYETYGSGTPLLVIHGGPGLNHDYLLPHLLPLASSRKVIFYDQMLCGKSDFEVDSNQISIPGYNNEIDKVRTHFTDGKIDILAHSWGGLLAMNYIGRYPDRVNKLILVDPVSPSLRHAAEESRMLQEKITPKDTEDRNKVIQSAAFRNGDVSAYEDLFKISFRSQFTDQSKLDKLNISLPQDYISRSKMLRHLVKDFSNYDFSGSLTLLKNETLLIYGKDDILLQTSASDLARFMKSSRMKIIENAGHFPFIESPKEFMTSVESFLNER